MYLSWLLLHICSARQFLSKTEDFKYIAQQFHESANEWAARTSSETPRDKRKGETSSGFVSNCGGKRSVMLIAQNLLQHGHKTSFRSKIKTISASWVSICEKARPDVEIFSSSTGARRGSDEHRAYSTNI